MAPSSATGSMRRRLTGLVGTALVALGLVGVLAGGTVVLHLRAAADAPAVEQPAVAVETVRVERSPYYVVEERFAGRLEPARETEVAFERAGLVTAVLVEEGDQVAAGEVLARLDTDLLEVERERLVAERAAVEADLELARLTEARQRDLTGKGFSSEQRYDEARLGVRALEARLDQIRAAIRAVGIDLEKARVRAPFAATVADRFVDDGRVVDPGAPLLRLVERARPRARIGLSPEAAAALDREATYTLRSGGTGLAARLLSVRPDLASSTRTVPVLFEVDDARSVPFGDVVELVRERRVEQSGFWLPREALTEGRKGLWDVFTVIDDASGPSVGREAVEVVHVAGDRVFVRGTLRDGAAVVASGPHRVIPGQRVEVLGAAS